METKAFVVSHSALQIDKNGVLVKNTTGLASFVLSLDNIRDEQVEKMAQLNVRKQYPPSDGWTYWFVTWRELSSLFPQGNIRVIRR